MGRSARPSAFAIFCGTPIKASIRDRIEQSGRAPSFPKAPFISMAISRILSSRRCGTDDHLSHPIPQCGTERLPQSGMMRRYQRIGGPAVLPLCCLAPHGVFPASRIAPRAVSSYLAFSTLPALRCQRTGGVFSVTLSVSARLGERRPRVLRGMLPYGVRTFLSESLRSDHLPSRRSYHREEKFAAKPFDQPSRVSIVTS